MYDTLRPELITATEKQRRLMALDPTYVVEKGMFLENSLPYLEVRRPFILGVRDRRWKPTIGMFVLRHHDTFYFKQASKELIILSFIFCARFHFNEMFHTCSSAFDQLITLLISYTQKLEN